MIKKEASTNNHISGFYYLLRGGQNRIGAIRNG